MARIPTWIPVVALALFDEDGRVLVQKRLAHKHHGGMWEFPGGKVEVHEKPKEALVREIAEELAIVLDPGQLTPSYFAEEQGDQHIVMILYKSLQPCGNPVARDGQEWRWVNFDEAACLPLAPMDRALLQRLAR